MKKRSERPANRALVRIGVVMEAVMTFIATNGPSFPWEIHRATGAGDAAVYKAVSRLYEWGWIRRLRDPTHLTPEPILGKEAYRHYYVLSDEGWWHLERHLIDRGLWTVELMEHRERSRASLGVSAAPQSI